MAIKKKQISALKFALNYNKISKTKKFNFNKKGGPHNVTPFNLAAISIQYDIMSILLDAKVENLFIYYNKNTN